MRKKYEEQYKTLYFFVQMLTYEIDGSDENLIEKINSSQRKLLQKQLFFEFKTINKLSEFLFMHVPSISFIFSLPFINCTWVHNPRKRYQIWCKAYDGYFTNNEIRKITEEMNDHEDGHHRDFWADTVWNLLIEQRKYIPIISEIKWIYNHHKYGKFFIDHIHL